MKKVYMIFAAFALFVLAMGVFSLKDDINFKSKAVLIDAVVTGMKNESQVNSRDNTVRTGKAPIVSYTSLDGKRYTCETDSYSTPPAYYIGQNVKVYYDPAHPDYARMGNSIGKSISLTVIGAISCILVVVVILLTGRKERARKLLMKSGMKIVADMVSVDIDPTIVMGKHPYVIRCKWKQNSTNKVYNFKSKFIRFNPTTYLGERKQYDVYIDPNDPNKYYMDISFLPKKG